MTDADTRVLVEAMGLCWHEFDVNNPNRYEYWEPHHTQSSGYLNICVKCREEHLEHLANEHHFNTWAGLGIIWEWASNQLWWGEFIDLHGTLDCDCGCNDGSMFLHFIRPSGPYNFPDEIVHFLKTYQSKQPL